MQNPKLSNKLPDSLILKSFILLLSIIFTPLGLALALALTIFVIALILATLIVLKVFALILAPVKFIISYFHPKKTISLDYSAQTSSISKTSEINQPNEKTFKYSDFFSQQKVNVSAEEVTKNKNHSTTSRYLQK